MSFAVVQNGNLIQVLQMDVPFTIGEKQYSSAFLRNSTSQEKLEAGVWEIIEGVRPDDRFYWVSGASYHINEVNSTVEASYPATAKDLEELKTNFVAQTKSAAGSALAATDWMVIRKAERDVAIPAEVVAARAQIVSDCNTKEAAILAAADVEALIAVLQG
jgi:hypothetical protein